MDHDDENETTFTKGGVATFDDNFVGEGFYGWMGYGGSLFCWNPTLKISFAYVPSDFTYEYERAGELMEVFKECAYNVKVKEMVIEEGKKNINDTGVWEDMKFLE